MSRLVVCRGAPDEHCNSSRLFRRTATDAALCSGLRRAAFCSCLYARTSPADLRRRRRPPSAGCRPRRTRRPPPASRPAGRPAACRAGRRRSSPSARRTRAARCSRREQLAPVGGVVHSAAASPPYGRRPPGPGPAPGRPSSPGSGAPPAARSSARRTARGRGRDRRPGRAGRGPEPFGSTRPGERALHRELLVEQHPDQQRERVRESSASASGSSDRRRRCSDPWEPRRATLLRGPRIVSGVAAGADPGHPVDVVRVPVADRAGDPAGAAAGPRVLRHLGGAGGHGAARQLAVDGARRRHLRAHATLDRRRDLRRERGICCCGGRCTSVRGSARWPNALVIAVTLGLGVDYLPRPTAVGWQLAQVLAGTALLALGGALYLTCNLGPGPRDGLMTGLHDRFGWRVQYVRRRWRWAHWRWGGCSAARWGWAPRSSPSASGRRWPGGWLGCRDGGARCARRRTGGGVCGRRRAMTEVALTFDMEHPSREHHDHDATRASSTCWPSAASGRPSSSRAGGRAYPDMARRVVAEGHLLGNHSHHHARHEPADRRRHASDARAGRGGPRRGHRRRPAAVVPLPVRRRARRPAGAGRAGRPGYRDHHWDVDPDDYVATRARETWRPGWPTVWPGAAARWSCCTHGRGRRRTGWPACSTP